MALFFSAATAAGAFGGLLAFGINKMGMFFLIAFSSRTRAYLHQTDKVGGRRSWSWIFILEGLATLVVAFFAPWLINDYPKT